MTEPRDCKHGRLARSCEICAMEEEIDDLKWELSVAREAQRCECSSDDACRFARERDALKAELAALTQQSFDLCPQCGWRTFIPGDGCLNCLTEDAKEKTE